MYSSIDDSIYESDYKSGYNSDNFGQSSLHGKRSVWDDLQDVKAEPPEFHRGTNPDNFIEWLNDIENIFEDKGYSDEKSYKVVVLKFKKYASLWWENVKSKRERDGKAKIKSWRKLKKLLKERFPPDSYKQDLYIKMTNFKQGNLNFDDYTHEFEQLMLRSGIQEKQEQTIDRYIGGLNHDIAEKLELQPYWTFYEECKSASKIEKRIKVKKVEKLTPKLIYKESNSFTNPYYKVGNPQKVESSTRQEKDKAPTLDTPKKKCFKCQGLGHFQAKCLNLRVMTLREVQEVTLVEEDEEEKPIYDDESCFEERVMPNEGELSVI
ncbi:putative nucleotidyltransferase, ribonuclease H [Tanacetum coccineum]